MNIVTTRKMNMIAMAIFGTISICVKNIELSSGQIALFRAAIAVVVIALFKISLGKKSAKANLKKNIPLLVLSGAAMGFNWILLFEAYRLTTVSVATLSYYFAPVLVMILSPLLFKEKMTARQIICFCMASVGLVLLLDVGNLSGTSITGILCGLGAATLYATVILLNKCMPDADSIDRTLCQLFVAALVLTPYVLVTSGIQITSLDTVGVVNLLIVGLVHTGLAYCLYFMSLRELKGQEVAILGYIDPLVAICASLFVFGEHIGVMQLIGGLLILGFTLLNDMQTKKLIES